MFSVEIKRNNFRGTFVFFEEGLGQVSDAGIGTENSVAWLQEHITILCGVQKEAP